MWKVLWKHDLVGVSPHSTGSLSGPRILYWIRPRMTGDNLEHSLGYYISSIITTGQLVAGGFQRYGRGAKGRVRELERRR